MKIYIIAAVIILVVVVVAASLYVIFFMHPETQKMPVYNPAKAAALYVIPGSNIQDWATANMQTDPASASLMQKIANQPIAEWFGGWSANVQQDVNSYVTAAAKANAVPMLVAYNIPHRDCGSYSAGGAANAAAYASWMQSFVNGLANHKAVVILEPDALSNMDCLSAADQQERLKIMSDAVSLLGTDKNASLYIDAGNPYWINPTEMAARLKLAGVADAQGFSLNVSNFYSTQDNINYGQQISGLLGGKHFVIDTSRNGLGPTADHQWCNPPGRALGAIPTTATGNALVDAYLWIKNPTESDGTCNGGPSAGTFWPQYAVLLAQNAGW